MMYVLWWLLPDDCLMQVFGRSGIEILLWLIIEMSQLCRYVWVLFIRLKSLWYVNTIVNYIWYGLDLIHIGHIWACMGKTSLIWMRSLRYQPDSCLIFSFTWAKYRQICLRSATHRYQLCVIRARYRQI